MHAAYRTHERIAVGRERKRAIDDASNSRISNRRESLKTFGQRIGDFFESRLQQIGFAIVPGCSFH